MTSGDELISVIIPAHNAERFVGETLASALAQTHKRIEVIVVDDGSHDDTAGIVAGMARNDPRVRLIRTDNRGAAAARNRAIAEASGDLIAPLDADDLWHPRKLERQLAVLREAPDSVGLVYCWSSGIDERGRVVMPTWSAGWVSGPALQAILAEGFVGNGSAPLMRRRCIEAVGGYSDAYEGSEDWQLYVAVAGVCDYAVVRERLVGYRMMTTNYSLNVRRTEMGIARVTDWARRTWPDLPDTLWRQRAFNVAVYLSFLAVRRGRYLTAIRYRVRALIVRPPHIITRSYFDFWAMLVGHLFGLRDYRWTFWRTPSPFLSDATPPAA